MKAEILSIQRYPEHGYVVRTELVESPDPNEDPVKMRSAYNTSGDYIGDPVFAKYLCVDSGIKPETTSPEHNVCSIGFCEKEQKWYGWSHRAMYGFGIGSEVKKGDVAHTPDNREELVEPFTETGRGEWTAKTLEDAKQMAIDFANSVA